MTEEYVANQRGLGHPGGWVLVGGWGCLPYRASRALRFAPRHALHQRHRGVPGSQWRRAGRYRPRHRRLHLGRTARRALVDRAERRGWPGPGVGCAHPCTAEVSNQVGVCTGGAGLADRRWCWGKLLVLLSGPTSRRRVAAAAWAAHLVYKVAQAASNLVRAHTNRLFGQFNRAVNPEP